MSGLHSGAYWNSFVTVTINTKVNNDLVLWNNPTSKWVNLNSITIYKKINIPISAVVDAGSSYATVAPTFNSATTTCFLYPLSYSSHPTYILVLQPFSMPYDWVESSNITIILHLYFSSAPTSGNQIGFNFGRVANVGGTNSTSGNEQYFINTLTANNFYDYIMNAVTMSNVLTSWNNQFSFLVNNNGSPNYSGSFSVMTVDIVYQSNCYGSSSTTSKK